jgi:hypothetical protein
VIDITFINLVVIPYPDYSVILLYAKKKDHSRGVLFLTIAKKIMNERSIILSRQQNTVAMTAIMPKSALVRVVEFFTERFDAISMFVANWTF